MTWDGPSVLNTNRPLSSCTFCMTGICPGLPQYAFGGEYITSENPRLPLCCVSRADRNMFSVFVEKLCSSCGRLRVISWDQNAPRSGNTGPWLPAWRESKLLVPQMPDLKVDALGPPSDLASGTVTSRTSTPADPESIQHSMSPDSAPPSPSTTRATRAAQLPSCVYSNATERARWVPALLTWLPWTLFTPRFRCMRCRS